jgi:hypothetical protein
MCDRRLAGIDTGGDDRRRDHRGRKYTMSDDVQVSSEARMSGAADGASTPTVGSRAEIKTVRLDPRDLKPSWPVAIASLERISDWSVLALRLGTLALVQACVRDLAQPRARGDLVVRLRELVDALAHMPLEL